MWDFSIDRNYKECYPFLDSLSVFYKRSTRSPHIQELN